MPSVRPPLTCTISRSDNRRSGRRGLTIFVMGLAVARYWLAVPGGRSGSIARRGLEVGTGAVTAARGRELVRREGLHGVLGLDDLHAETSSNCDAERSDG